MSHVAVTLLRPITLKLDPKRFIGPEHNPNKLILLHLVTFKKSAKIFPESPPEFRISFSKGAQLPFFFLPQ